MKKMALPFWNHNSAYYSRIAGLIDPTSRVLDVGCGDGTLARYLAERGHTVAGIDPYMPCIERAKRLGGAEFICTTFENYSTNDKFDAVVFAASIHHMDITAAVKKAKDLLKPGGKLIILGIASPSNLADKVTEAFRVIPAFIGSKLHKMRSSEELDVLTSYTFNTMDEVRELRKSELSNGKVRRLLYYRYLLTYTKPLC